MGATPPIEPRVEYLYPESTDKAASSQEKVKAQEKIKDEIRRAWANINRFNRDVEKLKKRDPGKFAESRSYVLPEATEVQPPPDFARGRFAATARRYDLEIFSPPPASGSWTQARLRAIPGVVRADPDAYVALNSRPRDGTAKRRACGFTRGRPRPPPVKQGAGGGSSRSLTCSALARSTTWSPSRNCPPPILRSTPRRPSLPPPPSPQRSEMLSRENHLRQRAVEG